MKRYHIQTSLEEFMNSITQREYHLRLADLEEEWQHPNLDQQYMMQIACEVARKFAKNPNSIQLKDFKLSFKKQVPLTREQQSAIIKRQTLIALGLNPNGGNSNRHDGRQANG